MLFRGYHCRIKLLVLQHGAGISLPWCADAKSLSLNDNTQQKNGGCWCSWCVVRLSNKDMSIDYDCDYQHACSLTIVAQEMSCHWRCYKFWTMHPIFCEPSVCTDERGNALLLEADGSRRQQENPFIHQQKAFPSAKKHVPRKQYDTSCICIGIRCTILTKMFSA